MLKKIRGYLKKIGANAIIIPHDDAYFNEDLRPEEEQLACVTGFTGSAGMAVITQKNAVLFVDGRYVEQAKKQTDFEVLHVPVQTTVLDWLNTYLPPKCVLAYDPWFHSVAQINRWMPVLEKKGIKLLALDVNPVDKLWLTRPAAKPICEYTYPQQYAGKTTLQKMKDVSKILKEKKMDVFVLCNADTTSWLLNKRSDAISFNPVFLDRLIVGQKGAPIHFDEKAAKSLKGKNVGIDVYETPVRVKQMLVESGAILHEMSNPFALAQAVKNKTELLGMEKAALLDSIAVCRFFSFLSSQIKHKNEYEITEYLEQIRRENPLYLFKSFEDVSAVGKNAALPHYRATKEKASKLVGEKIYLLDTGGQYWCGTTDMTRTVSLTKPTQEMKKRYTQVLKGHIALAKAVFPKGTTGGQLDCLARQYLWMDGVDFNHGTGHGIGCFLNVHEAPPAISPNNRDVLIPNMVLSNEPGFYQAGKFGIRIENMMKVVEKQKGKALGFEMITFVPFCNELIEKSLLTNDEKEWISCYYEQILKKVYPNTSKEVQQWLKKQMVDWIV